MSHKSQPHERKATSRPIVPADDFAAAPGVTLAPRWQLLLSAVIALHLLAVISAPLAAPPSSPLAQGAFLVFRPWLQASCLNNGYKFFAPEPGPSHLVRYELEMPDGSRREGVFPNLQEQWPRQLYHRHFMLSEKVDMPPTEPLRKLLGKSYAEHLLVKHGAKKATLFYREHGIPSPNEAAEGMKLTDKRLYREQPLYELAGDGP